MLQKVDLLYGLALSQADTFATAAERRRAWEGHRAELLATWVSEFPGTRPSAWWEYEAAGKKRKLLKGELVAIGKAMTRGIPSNFHPRRLPIVYESEAAYLARTKALGKEERAALGKGWAKVETILSTGEAVTVE